MNTPAARELHTVMGPVVVADDDLPLSATPGRSRTAPVFIGVVAVVTLAAIALWFAYTELFAPAPTASPDLATRPPLSPSAAPPPLALPELPTLRHPLPEVPAGAPLPALAESDDSFVAALAASLGRGDLGRWLVPQDLIRRIVVTVDNLPRKTMPQRMSPVKPVEGAFAVEISGGSPVVAAANAPRYEPLLRVLEATDAAQLAAVYVQWYPRFQEAYRELGYPNGHFNDRLVEAIDTLLATPATVGPLALVQPKVLWEYADPRLEALPAGQKVLLRMGPENADRVKARLAVIRRLVATDQPR
jgi:hypothetical protein